MNQQLDFEPANIKTKNYTTFFIAIVSLFLLLSSASQAIAAKRPNVILVITDDQGYGDVAAHGNKMIKTPNLDRLLKQSVSLTNFHVDPTCAPTRSALMSGRYSTRTGVWHTIMGRSLMSGSELTVAEVFKAAGYKTGMYGKWHLGDNAPCRPQDQGFDEVFYHGGGGVGQTPDYFGNKYFDDTYFRATAGKAGVPEKTKGYCTDIWFNNAMSFINKEAKADEPFFVYLSTNAPHGPFLVSEKYSDPYVKKGVSANMAKFYGMIENIDDNMARLEAQLNKLKIADDTILIFMTDNGSAMGEAGGKKKNPKRNKAQAAKQPFRGFNAGMRGKKGSEYEGGHRVPFFIRWPAGGIGGSEKGSRKVNTLCAHIDVLPTLVELCGIKKPKGPKVDGASLAAVIKSEKAESPQRTLIVHSQRIEHVQKWRKSSVMTQRWRLVNGKELYDVIADPGQTKNVATDNQKVVEQLTAKYDQWWKSLSPVFDQYVRIDLGSEAENPAHLTCHDWHTNNKGVPWHQNSVRRGAMANGFWAVNVTSAGKYEITLRRWPESDGRAIEAVEAQLTIGDVDVSKKKIDSKSTSTTFQVELSAGAAKLQTWLTLANGKKRGAYYVEVKRIGQGKKQAKKNILKSSKLGKTPNVHTFGTTILCGQPTQQALSLAKKQGVQVVITLRGKNELDWDEKTKVKELGMQHHRIAFASPESLGDDVFDTARKLLNSSKDKQVLLHCGSAHRVSAIWAAHRALDHGLSLDDAMKEAKTVGLRSEGYIKKVKDYVKRNKQK